MFKPGTDINHHSKSLNIFKCLLSLNFICFNDCVYLCLYPQHKVDFIEFVKYVWRELKL